MKLFDKRYHPPGTVPGTLQTTRKVSEDDYHLRLIDYTAESYQETEEASAEECHASLSAATRTWVHVQGSVTPTTLSRLGELFDLHSLALEDVVNVGQRPKMDSFEDHAFVVMMLPSLRNEEVKASQVSIFLGKDYLITFCNGGYDPFDPLRKRLRNRVGRIQARPIDFLFYSVLDVIIDEAFPVLELLSDRIDTLEEAVFSEPDREILRSLHATKRELLFLRRMLWPHREVVSALQHDETGCIGESTQIYLRDCYDHVVLIVDMIDNGREMTSSLLDVYLSSTSNRLNDIMRVLTIIATIFIPLSFIVGIYGMNFSNDDSPWAMPELDWYYGYPMLWVVMITVALFMLWLFKRKKWL